MATTKKSIKKNGVHYELKVPGVERKMLFSSKKKAEIFYESGQWKKFLSKKPTVKTSK